MFTLSDLHKNPWINLMAITPELNATIITGLKGKSKEEYDLYLQKLAEDTKEDMNIPRKQKYYDKTRGNPGMNFHFTFHAFYSIVFLGGNKRQHSYVLNVYFAFRYF